MRLCLVCLLAGMLVGGESRAASAHTITLKVRGLRSAEGTVVAGLYDRDEGFPVSREGWLRGATTAAIADGRATLTFEAVPPGTYAVAVFHDENDNRDLDTNFIGIPKEGVGASNDAQGRMGPPSWDAAKFTVAGDTTTTAKMKYY